MTLAATASGERARWRPLAVNVGVGVFAAVGLVVWMQREGDFQHYVTVGRLVLRGGHAYADVPPGLNTWPPFFSLVCVPLALLDGWSAILARGLWLLLNLVLVAAVLKLLTRLVHGEELHLRPAGVGRTLADPAVLIPLVLTARYLMSNMEHLQINMLVFALALSGLALQADGRAVRGGALLGLAAALKVMPVLFVPYLALRGRGRAALAAAVAAALFSLSPLLVFGPGRFLDYVGDWRENVAAGWGVGKMNHSVFAMLDRFLGHGMLPFTVQGGNEVPESGEPVVLVAVAVVAFVAVLLAGRAFRGFIGPRSWAALAEWSVVFACSALFAPVTWKAYLVVLLVPHMLLCAAWQAPDLDRRVRCGAGAVLLVSFVLGQLASRGVTGRTLSGILQMSSLTTLSALVVCGGTLWLRDRLDAYPARLR